MQPGIKYRRFSNTQKKKGFALPAVNVTGSSTINGVLETAAKLKAPVIIQFSNGGAIFNAGKGLSNENEKQLSQEPLPVQNTSTLWQKLMEQLLFYIQTTVQKNYCLGLTGFWMHLKNILPKQENRFSVLT